MTEPTLVVDCCGRPFTANATNRLHHRQVAKLRAEWRDATTILARAAQLPPMGRATATFQARYRTGRLSDADAIAPTAKACLDGLVRAGVLPDDTAAEVASVTYLAPYTDRSLPDALLVWIEAS